jgi:hypothetical protein
MAATDVSGSGQTPLVLFGILLLACAVATRPLVRAIRTR